MIDDQSTNLKSGEPELRLVLVTGASGAGRSTAVKCLEDFGFEAIDNLPLSLFSRLLDGPPMDRHLALGIDVRNRDFSVEALIEQFERLNNDKRFRVELLFLECDARVLVRRFSETRRPHPLTHAQTPGDGVEQEINLLAPIKTRATTLIDTTDLSPNELRAQLADQFEPSSHHSLTIAVQSFSYKRGVPRGVDFVFDVRFIKNPHWEPSLRALDGRDRSVANYVGEDPAHGIFVNQLSQMFENLLPAFLEQGKSHLSVAFGCTGGQHRSVAVAESFAMALVESGWQVSKRHREIERHSKESRGTTQTDGGST